MIRFLDVVLASLGLLVTWPLLLVLCVLGWRDTGSPIFRQERVGRFGRPFVLLKFRSMRVDTPHVATHLVAAAAVTPYGSFLRRSKLDELPQLWNVLRGDMSLVGPRPCIGDQAVLIAERSRRGLFDVRPGVTGLAQVQGVDMSDPLKLVELEEQMVRSLSLASYCRLILLTALGRGAGDRVRA